jgi:hypothetical protein
MPPKYLFAALLAIAVAFIGYVFIYKPMPEYSLRQVERAARANDSARFFRHVDLEAVSGSLSDQFMRYVAQEPDTDTLVSPQLEGAVSRYSRPELNRMFQTVVLDYVRHGKYPDAAVTQTYAGGMSPTDMLLRLQDAIVEKLTFRGFKTLEKRDGYAQVAANFYVSGTDERLPLEFRMRDQGRYWQIVEVVNLDDFLRRIAD